MVGVEGAQRVREVSSLLIVTAFQWGAEGQRGGGRHKATTHRCKFVRDFAPRRGVVKVRT